MWVSDERKPWEQMENEPNRWFQRFERFRLMGPGRSIEGAWKAEESGGKRPGKAWYKYSSIFRWNARAGAWDKHVTEQAEAEAEARWKALIMGPLEIQAIYSQQARADIGVFFKIVEEWTYYPLPTYDVIDAKEVDILDEDGEPTGEKKISYWVRHIAVDMDKVVDPKYSHLLAEFSDSPKDGITIKPQNKQTALQALAKMQGLMVNKTEITGKDSGPIEVTETGLTDEERARRIAALLDRARARRTGQPSGDNGGPGLDEVDT
jgi:hypothetical protein